MPGEPRTLLFFFSGTASTSKGRENKVLIVRIGKEKYIREIDDDDDDDDDVLRFSFL